MIRETEPQSRRDKRARIAKVFKGKKPFKVSELKEVFGLTLAQLIQKEFIEQGTYSWILPVKKSKAASDGAKTE